MKELLWHSELRIFAVIKHQDGRLLNVYVNEKNPAFNQRVPRKLRRTTFTLSIWEWRRIRKGCTEYSTVSRSVDHCTLRSAQLLGERRAAKWLKSKAKPLKRKDAT